MPDALTLTLSHRERELVYSSPLDRGGTGFLPHPWIEGGLFFSLSRWERAVVRAPDRTIPKENT
ncbi:hypothetical protein C3Z09_05110 [Lelliottia aquatilis]|nr:hypothetical protein C3Z09_05110 [Lelliottia aquatilis]